MSINKKSAQERFSDLQRRQTASFLNDNDPPENDSLFEGGPEVQAEIKRAVERLFPPKKPKAPDRKLAKSSSDESPDDSKKSD